MKVVLTIDISGRNPYTGTKWPKCGSEVELPDMVAMKLLNAGMARHTDKNAPNVEKAVVEAVIETANKRPKGRPVGSLGKTNKAKKVKKGE